MAKIRNVEPIDVSTLDPSREDAIMMLALKLNELIYQMNLLKHTQTGLEAQLTALEMRVNTEKQDV